jgi:hypothetical protein
MPIEVELPDGRIAEFPEGTANEVIESSILEYVQRTSEQPIDVPDLPPVAGSFPETEPKSGLEEFKRDLPALAGGIIAPLAASRLGAVQRAAPLVQRGAQVLAAGVGGAIGESAQVGKELAFDEEQAPQTAGEALGRIGYAGGEQMAFEGIGQLAIKVGQVVTKPLKPTMSELNKTLVKKFRETGGELLPAQVTDSWWVKQLDALSRGSLTGSGIFKRADAANEAAFNVMRKQLAKDIAQNATGKLTDDQIGQLFLNTVKGGRSAHSDAAKLMYAELDDLAGAVKVPMAAVKNVALEAQEQLARLSGVGSGEVDKQLLKQVSNLSETLTFADAHLMRSNLLSMQRDLVDVVGAGRAKKLIGDLVAITNKTMDDVAEAAGGKLLESYKATNKFWKTGKETFDNDFIGGLVIANKRNPERIGETIFRDGNVKEIMQARKALKTASKLDKSINSDVVWHEMQSGYLQSLLTKTANEEGVVSAKRLLKTFIDRKKNRTLSAAFTKEQRNKIREFAMIGERFQKSPEAGLGMVMNLAQAGTVAGLVGFQVIDPAEAAAIMITPRILAKALTNPKTTDLMLQAAKTKYSTTLGKQLATKLSAELVKLQAETTDEPLPQMGIQ